MITTEAAIGDSPDRPERSGGARGLLYRAIDSCIPESICAGDPRTLRRARSVVGFTLVMIALGWESVAFFHWMLPTEATSILNVVFLVGQFIALLVPIALRRWKSIALATNALMLSSFVVIAAIFVLMGGIRGPLLHWVALLPMLALLIGELRYAQLWAAVSFLLIGVFAAADITGVPMPDYWEASVYADAKLWAQHSLDAVSWIVVLFAIAAVHYRQMSTQTAAVERAEERIRYLAFYDKLTTLPNREHFEERLRHAIIDANESDRVVGVLYIDLDGFKQVNDSRGHALGDSVLKDVAIRLQKCVRLVDAVARASDPMVSRIGGDEFTVMLADLHRGAEAAIVARRILEELRHPCRIDGDAILIGASIGIAIHNNGEVDLDGLMEEADIAMYRAKKSGKNNFQFYAKDSVDLT